MLRNLLRLETTSTARALFFQPRLHYARGIRGQYFPGSTARDDVGVQNSLAAGEQDEEDIESWLNMENPTFLKDIDKQREKHRKLILYKTMERKYFRPPQEVNLLTWDAKEQIRYLHAEYPDQWTVDALAQSFPISRDGVKRLLASKYKPRSLEDVIKHDRSVQKHWLALKEAGHVKEGGPAYNRYQALLTEGKLGTMENAGGSQSLPMPARTGLLSSGHNQQKKKPGMFEMIVKDYCEKKQAPPPVRDTKAELAQMKQDGVKLLQDLAREKSAAKEEARHSGMRPSKTTKWETSYDIHTHIDHNMETEPTNRNSHKTHQSVKEAYSYDPVEIPHKTRSIRKTRRGSEIPTGGKMQVPLEFLQMTGTGKIHGHGTADDIAKMQEENAQAVIGSPESHDEEPFSHHPEAPAVANQDLWSDIRFDTPGGSRSTREEAYLYDPVKGYQHPFGKPVSHPDRVDVPKHKTRKGVIYNKDNVYYDEDGEFLYKVP